jgi:hypothetical protein
MPDPTTIATIRQRGLLIESVPASNLAPAVTQIVGTRRALLSLRKALTQALETEHDQMEAVDHAGNPFVVQVRLCDADHLPVPHAQQPSKTDVPAPTPPAAWSLVLTSHGQIVLQATDQSMNGVPDLEQHAALLRGCADQLRMLSGSSGLPEWRLLIEQGGAPVLAVTPDTADGVHQANAHDSLFKRCAQRLRELATAGKT